MSELEIHPFQPDDTDDVRSAIGVFDAARAADAPWEHPWVEEQFVALLRRGWDGEPPKVFLAAVDGKPVGASMIFMSDYDNTHLAWAWVAIDPAHRRQGHGSTLFEATCDVAREHGRTTIGTDGWESERTDGFAARHGLERKSQAIQRRQHLAELEPGLVQRLYDEAAEAAADYELVRVVGRTPPELVEGMVELVSAINDAPTDDLDMEDEVFTPERLAEYEKGVELRGSTLYRLVARHRATGALGGHTVVAVEARPPDDRRPARHGRRSRPPGAPARTAAQGRDAAVAGRGGAAGGDDRHVERRVQRPHDRRQRAAGLPRDGAGAAVPEGAQLRCAACSR